VTKAVGLGLDGHGQHIATCVLSDVDDVVTRAVVPDGVAHLKRALGIEELSAPVRKANDERRHESGRYYPQASHVLPRRKLARDDRASRVIVDSKHEPERPSVADEVADSGDSV